jgi:hypothetical protein
MRNLESVIKELTQVRASFDQIQVQLGQLREIYYGVDLYATLSTPIQEVKDGIQALGSEFKEIQLNLRGLRRIITDFYTEEILDHQREIEAYIQEIQKQKFESSIIHMQAETTIETLRAQNQHIQRKYQNENFRSAMELRFRINELRGGTSDPETLTILDDLVTRLHIATHPLSAGNPELEPSSPLDGSGGSRTDPYNKQQSSMYSERTDR